jgi:DNA-binding winged helix-turn-helix (wHTH) protein
MMEPRRAVVSEPQELSKIFTSMQVQFDRFLLDTGRAQLLAAGRDVPLTPKAFAVLCLLVERRPNVVDKDTIAAEVWGAAVSDASLTMVLTELRKALGDSASDPVFIRTAHRRGYAFCAEVQAVAAPRDDAAFYLVVDETRFPIRDGETIVGRDEACGIRLDEVSVSRRHARLVLSGGVLTVEDLKSTNGTLVNGRKRSGAVQLSAGDSVRIGGVKARIDAPHAPRSGKTVRLPGR